MLKPIIVRPEFTIECKGARGAAIALCSIVKVGIKIRRIDYTIGGRIVGQRYVIVIPKYRIEVSKH